MVQIEESSGDHPESVKVQQSEALHPHYHHIGVLLHILEGSLVLHLEKLLRVLLDVPLGSRALHPEEHCFKIQVHSQTHQLKEFHRISRVQPSIPS